MIHMVSMPFFGLLSFLLAADQRQKWEPEVSMPFFGLLSFLLCKNITKKKTLVCVNALLRASLISTVPSGNPLFIRLPSLIFASNSQNILIIRFFRRFFWLVLFRHKILRYLPILLIRSHAI